MPATYTYLISQTKEIRISGSDPLELAEYARQIFDGKATTSGNLPNVVISPMVERELVIRRESP